MQLISMYLFHSCVIMLIGSFDWLVMSAEHKELTSSGALATKVNNGRTVLHLLCELLSGNDAQVNTRIK